MSKKSINTTINHKGLLLRTGLGAFFLTNSIAAWTGGDEFKEIINGHAWLTRLASADVFVKIIGVNDALLFLLLVSGKYRKYAAIWGMIWISSVIFLTGFAMPDTIERLGIMLILAYYAMTDHK